MSRRLPYSLPFFLSCLAVGGLICPARAPAQTSTFDQWQAADPATQRAVLALARRAFEAYTLHHVTIAAPTSPLPLLRGRAGVFVSAMRGGAPRCCMGTVYPTQPTVAGEIIASACAAAGADLRFSPIRAGELPRLRLIVSLLTPPRPLAVADLPTLDPTRDGLVVQNGDRSGVVLSGETARVETMLMWGRLRAGASPTSPVRLFRLRSARFVEPAEGR